MCDRGRRWIRREGGEMEHSERPRSPLCRQDGAGGRRESGGADWSMTGERSLSWAGPAVKNSL